MKLKTPITDTRDLIELAFLVIEGAENAGIEKEYRKAARKALSLMIYAAEKMYGEESTAKHGETPQPDKPLPIMEGKIVLNSPHRGLRIEAEALASLAYAPDEVIAVTIREAAREAGFKIGDVGGPSRAPAPTKEERGADAPRNDKDGQKKREVYPDIYDHSDKLLLQERLEDYAEWAACNEWEVPLRLADDLKRAARFIRYCNAVYPRAMMDVEKAEFIQRELNKKSAETGTEEWP